MELRDLELLEAGLREACASHGLRWVIRAVDEHTSEGKYLVLNELEGRADPYRAFSASRRPEAPRLRRFDLGPQERVLALIDAMISVYEELPAIAAATTENLNQGWDGRATLVETLVFVEDQDGSAAVHVDAVATADGQTRALFVSHLRRMRERVMTDE